MTVADPAGDAPAAGDRDGLPRRGFRRLAEQGPGLLEGPVPSQSPCLQPLTPVRAHLRQAMTSSSYAGNPRFGYVVLQGSFPPVHHPGTRMKIIREILRCPAEQSRGRHNARSVKRRTQPSFPNKKRKRNVSRTSTTYDYKTAIYIFAN